MFVNESVKRCVVFLGAKEEGIFRPKATAFYVSIQDHGVGFRYLVTAEHVVSGLQTRGQEIWVRANLKNGRTREDRLSSAEWWMHPGSETEGLTDVASTGLKNRTEPAISLSTASRSGPTTKPRGALPPRLTPALVDAPEAMAISHNWAPANEAR